MPQRYRALELVRAYAGLRWGEAVGLRRSSIDVLRSRITVSATAVEVHGRVLLDQEPKTRRSRWVVPIARSVMARVEQHLDAFVAPEPDALVFTTEAGGPLFRARPGIGSGGRAAVDRLDALLDGE